MNKHSVALILHYYGKLPNYFPLWLKSAGANPNFTFMIFSDIDFSSYNVPANVKIFPMTFDEIKRLVSLYLDFEFVLNNSYKFCDYRPLYGLIFHEYLEGYDFWGYVDSDVIWGDIGKFITDDILGKYDKLYRLGHLTIYRNTEEINTFALHKLPGWNISYKDVYRTNMHMCFEEALLPENLFSKFTRGRGAILLA